jgi:TPR repeat protein
MQLLGPGMFIQEVNLQKTQERVGIQKPPTTFLTHLIETPIYDIKVNLDLHLLVNFGFNLFSFLSGQDATSFSIVNKGLHGLFQEHINSQKLRTIFDVPNWEGVHEMVPVAEPTTADDCCRIAQWHNGAGRYDLVVGWYIKAIALGSSDAYVVLGMMYKNGTKNENSDLTKARHLFSQAAALGSAQGYHYLALIYENGLGVKASTLTAIDYFQKAVDAGHVASSIIRDQLASALVGWCDENKLKSPRIYKYTYGTLLINGWGVQKDIKSGLNLLNEAHEEGHTVASVKLGEWYVQRYKSGLKQGTPDKSDKKKALFYLKHAVMEAENNVICLNALYALGCLYALSEDKQVQALNYFAKAADGGHELALIKMENLLLPQAATKQSNSEKIFIYTQLANVGSAEGHYQLAMLAMETGKGNVTSPLEKAAKKDHVNAQYELARRYEQKADKAFSLTKPEYLRQAKHWYEKASDGGHEEASLRLGQLSKDQDKKINYFQRAYRQGNKQAAIELGDFYYQNASESDPIPNLEKAIKCYQLAVKSGYTDAQEKLDGVELNLQLHKAVHKQAASNKLGDFYYQNASKSDPIPYLEKAKKYYQLAVNSGSTDAQEKLEYVELNLQLLA